MSIRPLPEEVVAQIKSSTAIVSLTGVALELVKNSLDAKAARIAVTVDFARGGCVVEDDGLGIPPAEFSVDGGLGKRYWTSKFHDEEPHLGQHGTFLASLSAVSLLTITSHHHTYRSQNSISFHHTKIIERQTPASAHDYIHSQHGTRVTVRNLFGNMPVRVKQRAMVVDQKTEQHRLRNALKRDAVGLLLSWQGPISLKICDGDGHTIMHVNTSNSAIREGSRGLTTARPRSGQLSLLLQTMTQANLISIEDWPFWVPASASTPAISVKGAISLEPAPTKHTQFISLGLRPLSPGSGGNELYDEVNRLFALSSFGTVEDDADVDEQERIRRLSDKRFKSDGYTKRQLKARKGVDRYPMFHLRISINDKVTLNERFIEDESNLQAVVNVINAMIVQWLSVHHFRPRNSQHNSHRFHTTTQVPGNSFEQGTVPSTKLQAPPGSPAESSVPGSTSSLTRSTKKRRLMGENLGHSSERTRSQAFADWSRIKSGRSSFFDTPGRTRKVDMLGVRQEVDNSSTREGTGSPLCDDRHQAAAFNIAPINTDASGEPAMMNRTGAGDDGPPVADAEDETVIWTDPATRRTHHLNARTGCLIPSQRPRTDPEALSPSTTRLNTSKLIRVASKPAAAEPVQTVWLNDLLRTWDNPVFKPSQQGIQQISLQGDYDQHDTPHLQNHTRCSNFDMQMAFNDAGSTSNKLSRDALRCAEVISQVDMKFILVRMTCSSAEPEPQSHGNILVLIDQHAADERVRVELLLHDLCKPTHGDEESGPQSKPVASSLVARVTLNKPLHFGVSAHERTHFDTFQVDFAAWGILYSVSSSISVQSRPNGSERTTYKLSVTALPPVIAERCQADPELLISFLRSAVWKYVESPPSRSATSNESQLSWVTKMATCPPGLVDMINSRACRSAIMFNDELSLDECKALVSKLADSVFPFMCAHGRPSMVPIVDLGRVGGSDHAGQSRGESFVDAWKRWKCP